MWGIPDAFIATRPTMADLINYNATAAEVPGGVRRFAPGGSSVRAGDIAPVEMRRPTGSAYAGAHVDGGRLDLSRHRR